MNKNSLLYLFFCFALNVFAQHEKDQIWSGLEFNHQLNKKIEYSLRGEYRSLGTEDPLNKFLEIGSAYKFNKYLNFKFGSRFSDVYENENKIRLYADAAVKWSKKKWPLKIQYRNRFQRTFLSTSTDHFSVYRTKLKLSWKLVKKLYFYSGLEYFYKFGDKNKWDNERFFYGLTMRFKKGLGMSLSYIIDEELNKKSSDNTRAIVFGLSYRLKRKSKAKKD